MKEGAMKMIATGIVRKIDDLGRVVIPKEIRRTMHIRDGDPLEIFTGHGGQLIFKKYSTPGPLETAADSVAKAVTADTGLTTVIFDRDKVIAGAGQYGRNCIDATVSNHFIQEIDARPQYNYAPDLGMPPIKPIANIDLHLCAYHVLTVSGNACGAIAVIGKEPVAVESRIQALLHTMALFLRYEMERFSI